jgi:ubiquinol-cytochrome c reductase cytochrome b subunit
MSWLWKWFTDRWPFYQLRDLLLKEDIPGGASFAYTLGTSLLMVFTLQAVTGVLQLFYYVPTIDHAYDSVSYLRTEVPFGWLIQNMHYWGAQAMVVLVALHMARVYIWGAYKKTPLTWFIGIALVFVVMALSYTGAPLIWDQKGYWAAEVGSSIAGEVPVVGDILKIILRGSEVMGQLALSRLFAFHIAIFAPLLALLIGAHMASFRTSGVGGPWSEERRRTTGPLWPDQIFKDMVTATVVFLALIALSVFAPVPYAGSADALNISYVPKPEWNFLFIYQALKYFKGPFEPIGAGGLPAAFILPLLLVPIIDRSPERNPFRRPVAMACLAVYGGLILTLTVVGYLSPGFAQMPETTEAKAERVQVSAAVERGEELFRSSGCLGCHMVHGKGGSVGPELSGDTLKGKSRQWLIDQITNSKSHFPRGGPVTGMTAFTNLDKEELNDIASYLMSLAGAALGSAQESGGRGQSPEIEKGKQVFQSSGCVGCHAVNGEGGSIGPELSGGTLRGKSRKWLEDQITDPGSHFPGTVMPAFTNLSREQLKNLVSYLMSLASGAPAAEAVPPGGKSAQVTKQELAPPAAGPPAVPYEAQSLEKPAGQAALIIGSTENGADLFREQCISCHGPHGKGGVKNPGSDDGTVPPLSPIDRALYNTDPKVFAQTIDKIIQHGSMPSGPHPALHMPAWGDTRSLTQQEIANLEAYIMAQNGVDRGKLLNPGMEPFNFFLLVIVVFVIAILILGGIRSRRRTT